MKKIFGTLLAVAFVASPLAVLADAPAPPVEIHAKTSYHDAQNQNQTPNQIQPTTGTHKNDNGEFVEYFSVPVPGGQAQYGPPPTIAPQAGAPPAAYGAMPTPAQVNNVYWQMANNPYPFGIVNFDGNDYYGDYGYPYGYGYGYGGYGYGYGGFGFGSHHHFNRGSGFGPVNQNGLFYNSFYQTLTPNGFGVNTPTGPAFTNGNIGTFSTGTFSPHTGGGEHH